MTFVQTTAVTASAFLHDLCGIGPDAQPGGHEAGQKGGEEGNGEGERKNLRINGERDPVRERKRQRAGHALTNSPPSGP